MKIRSRTTKGVEYRDAREYRLDFTNGLTNGFVNGNRQKLVRKKEEKKYGKILAIFLLGLLLVSVSVVLTWENGNANKSQSANSHAPDVNFDTTRSPEAMMRGTPHAPIHITSNSGFTSANGVVSGSGTQSDPYIIEGWDIDGNGGSYCIWIENTTAYFVIRNCSVFNATNTSMAPSGSGIAFSNVTNGTIMNNNANGNGRFGIYLKSSSNNKIMNNNASSNWVGILLENSSNSNTITNNNVSGNTNHGIVQAHSNNNTITNNIACDNSDTGIYLYSANNNTITNNTASGNSYHGIWLYSSNNNKIMNNNASGNVWCGILLYSSSNYNTIANNNACGNRFGIFLYCSTNNEITNNTMGNSGIVIRGNSIEHWNTHNIDTTNLVNGKPVYYYKNLTGGSVSSEAGQVILANCTNMIIEGLSISNASIGIQLGFSSSNIINNNLVMENIYGIYLEKSSNNAITNNNASSNRYGIYLDSSSNNTITYNWLCTNTYAGVYITGSSTGNTIHHNNFIANNGASKGTIDSIPQAYDDGSGNSWFDATAREGNYWSNWDGNGWGTMFAYLIPGSALASDYYPLTGPVVPEISGSPVALLVFAVFLAFMLLRRRK